VFIKKISSEQVAARDSVRAVFGIEGQRDVTGLSEEDRLSYCRAWQNIEARWSPASIQDFVDHIDDAVELTGLDQVGISSHFGGGEGIDRWREDSETWNVALKLVRRGDSEEDIAKLWADNIFRVLEEAERIAQTLY